MLVFDELETVRSVQLYGTDPVYVAKATEILCAEYGVAHIDLNFGCPSRRSPARAAGERSRGSAGCWATSSSRRSPPPRRTTCRSR